MWYLNLESIRRRLGWLLSAGTFSAQSHGSPGEISPPRGSGVPEPIQPNARRPLGSSHTLKRNIQPNGNCPLCTLVYASVTAASGRHVNVKTECLIEWVLDGQPAKSTDQYDSFSRRIRISWSRPDRENAPKGKEREELYFIHTPPPNADSGSMSEERTDSLARDYRFTNGNIYERIRRWITLCDHNHQNPYDPLDDREKL